MIELKNITKQYTSTMGVITECLNDVNLKLDKGRICAICGPSGSGKSTLLNLIGGLDTPTSGEIIINGIAISNKEMNKEDFRLNEVGIIFQSFNLIDILTASENIILPAELSSSGLDKEFYNNIIQFLGIEDLVDKYPSELSGGQQQRVAIARALINKPGILLADEPTGNLDSKNADNVIQLLVDIAAEYKMTLLVVTHDSRIAEKCEQVLYVEDGRVYEK